MTDQEYHELHERERLAYADFEAKKKIADAARDAWCPLYQLINHENQRREIIAEMQKEGAI